MIDVKGFWPRKWNGFAECFEENFTQYGEVGAAVAVVHEGALVASLWAGKRDMSATLAWQEDTCVNVFSAGKGLVAGAFLTLVDAKLIDLASRVSDYWPEFSGHGKENITIAQVLHHQSGLCAFHPNVKKSVIFNEAWVRALIEYEKPWWEPGIAQGYSPFIWGWILATLVERVCHGSTFSEYFKREVSDVLGLNCYFGVPAAHHGELADVRLLRRPAGLGPPTMSVSASGAALSRLMKADPKGVTNRAFSNPASLMLSTNTPEWRESIIPAANCHIDAKSLAKYYGALSTGTFLPNLLPQLESGNPVERVDRVLGMPLRFSHGFMLSQETLDTAFGGMRGFGHPGAGGSLGFADPEQALGFGYTTSLMGQSVLIDERARRLMDRLFTLVS